MKRTNIITMIIPLLLLAAGAVSIWLYRDTLGAWLDRLTLPAAPQEQPVAAEEPPAPQAQPRPIPQEQPQPIAPPAPPVAAEPAKPAPKPLPPTERAHSAEHSAALQVATAARAQQLEAFIQQGRLSPEDARTLRTWAEEHPDFKVEEVGLAETQQESGEIETRYRFVSADGKQDLLISVATPADGKPSISRVQPTAADKTAVTSQSDAMSVVEGFIEALRRGDMGTARRMTQGGDISDATLAGLCIMFEEGDFALRKKLPIRNMFMNEGNAGYLIYMTSQEDGNRPGNVGVEMSYDAAQGWRVKAVALDDLLNRYETSGAAEGGAYFPLVKNPQGGDSLVLYFGFNDASLSPRSLSQLRIVANLLKGSKGVLNISGHTDDIGTTAYNQQLSERRALSVKEALISAGVSAEQITTRGLGKSQPRRTYHTGDNRETIRTIRSGNRRAEIYLDF